MDVEHIRFIRSCRDFFETDESIFSHANVDADLPLDRQPSLRLRWEHVERELQRPNVSGKTVVGHTP